jgi:hypothetical protein
MNHSLFRSLFTRFSFTLAAGAALFTGAPREARACTPTSTFLCDANPAGTILTTPKIYIVYWGFQANCSTTSCPSDTANFIPIVEQYLRSTAWSTGVTFGMPGTRWWNVPTQYTGDIWGVSGGPYSFVNQTDIVLAPSYFDNDHEYIEYGAWNGLQAIQDEVHMAVLHFQNKGYTVDGNSLIIIVRPPGSVGDPSACAYHGELQPQYGYGFPYAYVDLNYGAWYGGQSGNQCYYSPDYSLLTDDQANMPAVLHHEIMEAITDPRVTLNYPNNEAWVGSQNNASTETGDMCWSQTVAIVATQPRVDSHYIQAVSAQISDRAPGGACVYARATQGDYFTVGGSNGHLWHEHIPADSSPVSGLWYDWGMMGSSGTLNSSPAAVSWAPGRQDVFVVDNQSHLRHAYVDSAHSSCLGPDNPCFDDWGVLSSTWEFAWNESIGVASWGPGRLDVFATGLQIGVWFGTPHLFQRIWDTGDYGWQDRGAAPAPIMYGPAAVSYGPGTVDVFVVGTDQNIYRGTYTQAGNHFVWTLWHGKPGTANIADSVDVAESAPGQFDVMVVDTSGALYDCGGDAINGAWANCVAWTPPSGVTVVGKPSVVGLGDQRLLVGIHGSNGGGWVKLYDFGQNTGPWVSIGGSLTYGPDLSSW